MSKIDDLLDDYIMNDRSDLNVIYVATKKIASEYKSLIKKTGSHDKAKEIVMRIINDVDVSVIMEDESHETVPDLQQFEQLWLS